MKAWSAVALVALGAAVAQAFGRFTFGVLLPAIREDLQLSNTLAGTLGAANVTAYLIGTVLVAWATGHYRLLQVWRVGMGLAVLGLFVAATADGVAILALGLFITGLGGACVWIPAPVLAADAMPPAQRSIAVGLLGSGMGIGILFSGMLGSYVRSNYGDDAWATVYLIQGLVGVVVMAASLLVVRHQQTQPSATGGIGGFAALKRMPGWQPLMFAYAAFGFMYLLVLAFLTIRLEADSAWSAVNAALVFSALGVSMIAGGPLFITLAGHIGTRLCLTIAFLSWSLLVGMVLTGWPISTFVAAIGLGLLFSAIPSMITLYIVEHTTAESYGPSFSAATLVFGLAQMASPQVGGLIADLSGSFTAVFVLSALVAIFGALAVWQLQD